MSLATAAMQFVALGEVAAAMALGGAIGYERESANRPAGFRTHMLVAGAAALLVALGDALVSTFGRQHEGLISADPFRLVGGVITTEVARAVHESFDPDIVFSHMDVYCEWAPYHRYLGARGARTVTVSTM